MAQEPTKALDISFNLGAATDYVYHGVSQSDGNPQLSAGVDTTLWGVGYVGTWISRADFDNGTDAEYDLYVGARPQLGPVTLDLGVIYYGYINQAVGPKQDFVVFKLGGAIPLGAATLGAEVHHSNDFFGQTGKATYVELNGAMPIAEKFKVSGALGHQKVAYDGDYTTWNLGVSYAVNDVVGLDLRYHDTDAHDLGDIYDGRVVLGVKAAF